VSAPIRKRIRVEPSLWRRLFHSKCDQALDVYRERLVREFKRAEAAESALAEARKSR
jgi:hypothetical protein